MLSQLGQQQIQLVILSQANNYISFSHALFHEQVDIGAITAQNETIMELGSKHLTAILILLDNLYLDALSLQHGSQKATGTTGTNNQYLFQLVIGIAKVIFKLTNRLVLAHKINIVTGYHKIVTTRNNHPVTTKDHGHQNILRNL